MDLILALNNYDRSCQRLESNVDGLSKYFSRINLCNAFRELGRISNDDDKFQVNVDVQQFSPEEISVKVVDGYVVIDGSHKEKLDQDGFVSRQYVKRYKLPPGCLPDTVESKLSSDGVLTLTAPKVLPMPSTGERIVPVKFTGPIKKTRTPGARQLPGLGF